MIIDFRADGKTAQRYDVLCARTGENLSDWHIWYADDETGIVRRYETDDAGNYLLDESGKDAISSGALRKAIKIVAKPVADLAAIDTRELLSQVDAVTTSVLAEAVKELARLQADEAQARYHRDVLQPHAAEMSPRRVKLLRVTDELFLQFFHAGVTHYEITDHPVPDDARLIDVAYDPDMGIFTLKVESESFPPVGAGEAIPEMRSPAVRPLPGDHDYESPDW